VHFSGEIIVHLTEQFMKFFAEKFVAYNAAFTLIGFDNQERNLTFVKMDFQLLNLDNTNRLLYKLLVQDLVVKPACINAA